MLDSPQARLSQVQELLRPRVEGILAAVGGGQPFDEAAAAQGVAATEEARKLPQQPENDADRFLAGAKKGDTSGPLPQAGGAILLLHVLEVERPQDAGVESPTVLREYSQRIHELRRRKAEALLRLEALDSCTVRPERVRTELREVLLANLRDAQSGLRELGLH